MISRIILIIEAVVLSVERAAGDWVVIDTTSSETCDTQSIQSQTLTQVGSCLEVPSLFPASVQIYESYKFSDCEQNGNAMTLTVSWYLDDDCSGTGFDLEGIVLSNCVNGSSTSCQSNPISVDEDWPAIGVYTDDDDCETAPNLVMTYKPDDCVNFSIFGDYSTQVTCDETFEYKLYNSSTSCVGDTSTEVSSELEECSRFTYYQDITTSSLLPSTRQQSMHHTQKLQGMHHEQHIIKMSSVINGILGTAQVIPPHDLERKRVDGRRLDNEPDVYYYYASCEGTNEVNGVEGSGKSSDDDDKYSGLGEDGLAVLLVFVLLGVFAAVGIVGWKIFGKSSQKPLLKEGLVEDNSDL